MAKFANACVALLLLVCVAGVVQGESKAKVTGGPVQLDPPMPPW